MKCYVFSSVVRTVMSISLDNPGFLLDVSDQVDVHRPDASSIASGSSSLGESTRRSCPRCHGRMSSISLDRHVDPPLESLSYWQGVLWPGIRRDSQLVRTLPRRDEGLLLGTFDLDRYALVSLLTDCWTTHNLEIVSIGESPMVLHG